MRLYDFFTFGAEDEYGQKVLSPEPQGQIKMAINEASHTVQDNILFKNCTYVGLTHSLLDDSYVIKLNDYTKLKVFHINPKGRLNQVFMSNYD